MKEKTAKQTSFSLLARILHWFMAILIIAMIFIGLFMANSDDSTYTQLVDIHRPLGLAILWLATLRLLYRLIKKPPQLPASYPKAILIGAHLSHIALYSLMFLLPLIGWAMLSAADYPITIIPGINLPQIMPHNAALWAFLRSSHQILAYCFFGIILLHIAAALFHFLILRDNVLNSMIGRRKD